MSTEQEEVKEFIETIPVEPVDETEDTEVINEEENETPSEPSTDETEEAQDEEEIPVKKDELLGREKPIATVKEPKPVAGETPRERGLRQEVERLRAIHRKDKQEEIFTPKPHVASVLSDEKRKALEKYNPEELSNFKEVMEGLADELGFVKKSEYQAQSYQTSAEQQFDSFMEEHPEYSPENDKDGIVWNQFKEEYSLYKQPENPKAFKTLFNKIHKDIFGIQPAANLNKIKAQQEKIKVASHAGASVGAKATKPIKQAQGLRTDMLKGFSEEEKAELLAE